jgi:hypothetical protein
VVIQWQLDGLQFFDGDKKWKGLAIENLKGQQPKMERVND